jgi:Zn finger protein HypA/HybF involved in hydrogenase expression
MKTEQQQQYEENMTKVPGTKFEVRIDKPPEQIEFRAHQGECKYCGGIVKMYRDQTTMRLQPDNCRCPRCGQSYFVVIEDTIEAFELQQWRQKGQKFAMGGD